MATSSITKNFVISDREQVEMFVNAIDKSIKYCGGTGGYQ